MIMISTDVCLVTPPIYQITNSNKQFCDKSVVL